MDVRFGLDWTLRVAGEPRHLDPQLFVLLRGIREAGQLNAAARAAGISYRHAWGLIRDWEQAFGKALISARQGRGARLAEFGEVLLAVEAEVEAQLAAGLEGAAADAAARLTAALQARRPAVRIASSHSDRVIALREALTAAGYPVTFEIVGSTAALQRLRHAEVEIAGFHLPLGALGRTVAARIIALLDPRRDEIHLLEVRTLGLMSRAALPCDDIEALAARGLRFINRQAGAATRLVFDGLLAAAGIAPEAIRGYASEEYTHTAVAAVVASGGADAGFGSRSAAERMDLHFAPLVEERFYIAVSRDADIAMRRNLVQGFCRQQSMAGAAIEADELSPTVAVLKRVHDAGFWKRGAR